jgi:two-component system response regulator AtoC
MSDGKEVMASDITFASSRSGDFLLQQEKTMKEYSIHIIQHYLKKYDQNVVQVANMLDIGKSTIYKMIQQKEIAV